MTQMLLEYFILFTVQVYLNSSYFVRLVTEKQFVVENTELVGTLRF